MEIKALISELKNIRKYLIYSIIYIKMDMNWV